MADREFSLFAPTGRCELARRHQISNILLEELVMAIELVMLFLDRLDSVEEREQGVLQRFGVP